MRNFKVKKAGGADNRGGTEFVAELSENTSTARFIPFIFSRTQAYILEFQDQKMRVHKNGVLLTDVTQNISGITAANPAVLNYAGADSFPDGTFFKIAGIDTENHPAGQYYNNRIFKSDSENTGANTVNLKYNDGDDVDSSGFGAAVGASGTISRVYEIATPYATADLADLKFAQSGDTMRIVHPSYAPRILTRNGDTSWTLGTISFVPTQAAPTAGSVSNQGAAGSTTYNYKVTAISDDTGEESLGLDTSTATGNATLNGTNFNRITYTPAAGATQYSVYKLRNGTYGFIGISSGGTFDDIGYTADTSDTPTNPRNPFGSSDNYPSCVAFYQQRAVYANTNNNTELVEASQTGSFNNFGRATPIRPNDAVTFSVIGSQINSVKHLLDLGNLILFNDTGEKACLGDSSGNLTPIEINPKQYSYNGSANNPPPLIVDNSAIYVQAGGSVVRDFAADIAVDGYRGNDLTNFADHLFRGRTIVDWCYQKTPDSVIWIVRDDGFLLSLTYIKEQQMLAWARHDFDGGFVENCACIPNGNENDVYFLIRRTVNGVTKRYVEKLHNREIAPKTPRTVVTNTGSGNVESIRYSNNVADKIFCDSALTYDGRNDNINNLLGVNLDNGATGYTADTICNVNVQSGIFTAGSVGNEVHITAEDGIVYRIKILTYINATNILGRPDKTLPDEITGGKTTTDWAIAVDRVEGLWHLEAKDVSVIGDATVVSSPYNPAYADRILTVENGAVDLPSCYAVIHVGLPYVSDLETLSLDTAQPNNTSVDKKTLIKHVWLQVENTRGLFVGTICPEEDPTNTDQKLLFELREIKQRDFENYDTGTDLLKGKMDVIASASWGNSNDGRVFIRQVDPLPATILSISPEGILPFK